MGERVTDVSFVFILVKEEERSKIYFQNKETDREVLKMKVGQLEFVRKYTREGVGKNQVKKTGYENLFSIKKIL